MHNSEYISCDRLQNGIDFELDNIEVCCFRCHKGGGNISLAEIQNGSVDYDSLIKTRTSLIDENKSGKVNAKCEGCFHLEKKEWDKEEPCIKYIHFNHWTYCNSNCIYCYTKNDKKYNNGMQHYQALPVLKEILKRVKFSPSGEITFAGGEPLLLDEFDEIIEYLLSLGAKKIVVHSSGIKYSAALAKALNENKAQVIISHDSGNEETYNRIKNVTCYNQVWENTAKYALIGNKNAASKYIFIPGINDNTKEIDEWISKVADAGIKSVILDIEHNYYANKKKDLKACLHLLSLCEYVKKQAKSEGINVFLYNAASYLYNDYKYFVPLVKYKNYFIELLILSFPLLIGNLGHTLIGATDIFVVAKYNIDSLAAISIANSILFSIFIFGIGIINAVSIILSNKRGSREKIKKYLSSTVLFSIVLAFIFMLLCYSTVFLVDKLSFEAQIVPYIKEYIKIVSFSMFGLFLYQGIKEFFQSYEIVNFPNMLLLAAVVINLIFDIVLVFGIDGIISPMGSKGAAIATLSVRTIIGFVMLLTVCKKLKFKDIIDVDYIKQIIRIGYPIGAALTLEFLAFNIITILVGRESGVLAATHNIITTISSTSFMVPLAISTAVAIKVAYYYGAKKADEIKRYSYAGIITGVSFMALCSLILAIFPAQLIKIFTDNSDVLQIALPIILIAAMYQVFDGFQVVAGGVLKGFKMTKVVSSCVLFGYWFIGMPIAYILVYKYDYSLKGYWIAVAVSLFAMGVVQALIAKYKFNEIKKMYQ